MGLELMALVPALPIAGFAALVAVGRRLSRRAAAVLGVGSVGLAAIVAIAVAAAYLAAPPEGCSYTQDLWQWMRVDGFGPRIAFHLDALSLVMMLVVAVVSFLILLYSAEFMAGDEGFARFFAYMNLFVGSMLILVLADNLLLLYLGWEGVGLCSYLLIGFWYKDPANGRAAMKAFIVTRVGDAALVAALLLIFTSLGTLDIAEVGRRATNEWPAGSALAVAAALLLLGGAVGKSAQLPLQTWLPDAMAGPTPTSALIHAATMVTAGVYLVARMNVLFALAPPVQFLVAVIGAATLLLAGASGLAQHDIKRVLAYSTISQVGYMFLGLGVGAWGASIFHFLTHAFFKSLLFLAAGVVILNLGREHNMFRMGGLRKLLPLAFWTFLVGSLALAGLPPLAGFASKDLILYRTWTSTLGGPLLWLAGVVGIFLTSVYTFRMVFLVFFGPASRKPEGRSGAAMTVALVVLAAGCLLASVLGWPEALGGTPVLVNFLELALPEAPEHGGSAALEGVLSLVSVLTAIAGILVAYVLFLRERGLVERLYRSAVGSAVHSLWLAGWGFDRLYETVLVAPLAAIARLNRGDFVDIFYRLVGRLAVALHSILSFTQTGRVRWYAAGLAVGAIIILAIVVAL